MSPDVWRNSAYQQCHPMYGETARTNNVTQYLMKHCVPTMSPNILGNIPYQQCHPIYRFLVCRFFGYQLRVRYRLRVPHETKTDVSGEKYNPQPRCGRNLCFTLFAMWNVTVQIKYSIKMLNEIHTVLTMISGKSVWMVHREPDGKALDRN